MDQVAPNLDGEIPANGAWCRLGRISGAHHTAHDADNTLARYSRDDDRTGCDVLDQTGEERLALVNAVVASSQCVVDTHKLQAHELQTTLLDPGQYRAN